MPRPRKTRRRVVGRGRLTHVVLWIVIAVIVVALLVLGLSVLAVARRLPGLLRVQRDLAAGLVGAQALQERLQELGGRAEEMRERAELARHRRRGVIHEVDRGHRVAEARVRRSHADGAREQREQDSRTIRGRIGS